MAISTYSTTPSDVKSKAPVDTRAIGASTEPVSDTDIEGWIEEASAELTPLVDAAGKDLDSLTDGAEEQIRTAIVGYAVAELLSAIGHTGDDYESARERYIDFRDRLKADSDNLDGPGGGGAKSNVPPDREKSSAYSGSYQL